MENEKVIKSWQALFSDIAYAYDMAYTPRITTYNTREGGTVHAAIFHKLTIYSDGRFEYKGQYEFYDPELWWKVEMLVKLFEDKGAMKVLYGR